MLIKSEQIQSLLKRGCSGTILTAIGKDEIEKVLLPKIDLGEQAIISDLVKTGMAQRMKSSKLQSTASRVVEISVSEGYKAAMNYLEEARHEISVI